MNNSKIINLNEWKNAKERVLPCLMCISYVGGQFDGCGEYGDIPDNIWHGFDKCEHMIDYDNMEGDVMNDEVRVDRFTYEAGDVRLTPLQCMFCKYYKGGKDGCTKLVTVPTPVWEKTAECTVFEKE